MSAAKYYPNKMKPKKKNTPTIQNFIASFHALFVQRNTFQPAPFHRLWAVVNDDFYWVSGSVRMMSESPGSVMDSVQTRK